MHLEDTRNTDHIPGSDHHSGISSMHAALSSPRQPGTCGGGGRGGTGLVQVDFAEQASASAKIPSKPKWRNRFHVVVSLWNSQKPADMADLGLSSPGGSVGASKGGGTGLREVHDGRTGVF